MQSANEQKITAGKIFDKLNEKYKVIITFVEEIDETEELRNLSAQTDSLEFWENEEEDIYQDYLVAKSFR